MPRRPLASLLVLIAVIGFGLFWLVRSIGPRDSQAPSPAAQASPAAAAAPEAPAPEPQIDAKSPEIETAAANPAREEAPADSAAAAPADARWIEGRVRFPDGTPADERAEVVATHGGSDEKDPPRAHIEADGSFRIAIPKDAEKMYLDVRGRYVYLPKRFAVPAADPAKTPAEIVLALKLGGCIHGRLILPANALDRRASVVGARVRASAIPNRGPGDFQQQIERHARADDKLEFELGGIPEKHRIWIGVQPEGMADVSDDKVQVQAGLVVPLDLELMLGAHVSGRVVDEKGEPVADVELSIYGEQAMSSWSSEGKDKTRADGKFDLPGIKPCSLTLGAKKDGFATARLEVGKVDDGAVQEGLEIVLARGLAISGRVQWPDGRPAAGCPMEASFSVKSPGRFRSSEEEHRKCSAAADGAFTITGLGSDPITLIARIGKDSPPALEKQLPEKVAEAVEAAAAKLLPASADSAPAAKPEPSGPHGSARAENVQPGTSGLVLTLQPEQVVRGRALDDAGQPIASVRVGAEPIEGENPWERSRKAVRGGSTGEDGTFEIEGLHDGGWDVTAEAKGHAKSSAHRVVLPGGAEPFDLVLPRVASVSGTVTDPAGAPVENAAVREDRVEEQRQYVFRSGDRDAAHTDAQGKFELANLAPGPGKIVASAEGFGDSAPVAVELQPAQAAPGLLLSLRRPGRIVGEVLDDAGRPDPDRAVNLQNMTPDGYRRSSADASGHFEFEGLTPGRYFVHSQPSEKEMAAMKTEDGEPDMSAWARLSKQTAATVSEGETVHVVLGGAPRDGIRIHGKVTCAGRPVAGCSLWLYRADGGIGAQVSGATDSQGQYELTVEGAGTYGFAVNDAKSGTSFSDQVAVPAGASFEHDVVLPAGRIAGRVFGIDGAPAVGVYVILQPDGRTAELSSSASYGQKQTDEKGAFVFEGLKGATYRLQAGDSPWDFSRTKSGMCVRTGIVLAEGGHVDDLEVRLQTPARIEGLVTGPDGQAVAGAGVIARDEQGEVIQRWPETITDGSGRFSMDALTPGKVTVTARTLKLVSPESPALNLRAGETSRVELAARPGTMLRVIVQEGDGKVVGASITVTDDRGRDCSRGSGMMFGFDSGGDANSGPGQRIGPVLPGQYRVTATNHDRASVSQDVSVSGDEQVVTLKYGG